MALPETQETPTPSQPNEQNATPQDKTNRLLAWSQLLRSITPIIWIVVILIVIIPLLGQFFISRALTNSPSPVNNNSNKIAIVESSIDWSEVDDATALALRNAHDDTHTYAAEQLDVWVDELMSRVDSSFLDWYFNYFTQKQIEFKSFVVQLSAGANYLLNSDHPTPNQKVAEVFTENFQQEFAKRVLRPKIAQLRLERITQATVKHYLNELSSNIDRIQATYQIPQADWNRYLSDIAVTSNETGSAVSNLSMKVLVGGGGYLAAKPLVAPLISKVGSKVVAKLAGKTGAKVATKTGANLTGKLGAELLDPIVGVGIIIWDVWDYNHTVKVERPLLRETIADYLQEVKFSLLDNPDNGIMTIIEKIENTVINSESRLTPA